MRKLTQEEVIERFRKVHGGRYDYSLVEYVRTGEEVWIVCKHHGKFRQAPNDHLRGRGCKECYDESQSLNKLPPKQYFIDKLVAEREDKGNFYDYSNSVYRGARKEVSIRCPKHGEFMQLPQVHYRNGGCQQCANEKSSESRVLTQEDFLSKCMETHGDTYDYSQTTYKGYTSEIVVRCMNHGEFSLLAGNHLSGQGCQVCAIERTRLANSMSWEEFILKVTARHENKFIYIKSTFKNASESMECICLKHGKINIIPTAHIRSETGCWRCARGKTFSKDKDSFFYVVKTDKFTGFGITNKLIERKRKHKRELNKHDVKIITFDSYPMRGEFAWELEKKVKKEFPKLNTGIKGFKREATCLENYDAITSFVSAYIKENALDI